MGRTRAHALDRSRHREYTCSSSPFLHSSSSRIACRASSSSAPEWCSPSRACRYTSSMPSRSTRPLVSPLHLLPSQSGHSLVELPSPGCRLLPPVNCGLRLPALRARDVQRARLRRREHDAGGDCVCDRCPCVRPRSPVCVWNCQLMSLTFTSVAQGALFLEVREEDPEHEQACEGEVEPHPGRCGTVEEQSLSSSVFI